MPSLDVQGAKVGELNVQVALCGPASVIVIFLETQLVHPHFSALLFGRFVPHSYDHGLYFAQCGVAFYGYPVARSGGGGIEKITPEGGGCPCFFLISVLFSCAK